MKSADVVVLVADHTRGTDQQKAVKTAVAHICDAAQPLRPTGGVLSRLQTESGGKLVHSAFRPSQYNNELSQLAAVKKNDV